MSTHWIEMSYQTTHNTIEAWSENVTSQCTVNLWFAIFHSGGIKQRTSFRSWQRHAKRNYGSKSLTRTQRTRQKDWCVNTNHF